MLKQANKTRAERDFLLTLRLRRDVHLAAVPQRSNSQTLENEHARSVQMLGRLIDPCSKRLGRSLAMWSWHPSKL